MRTIETRTVRFGELAGSLVHGSVFFDWELISTQEYASSIDYSFEDLISVDEIPYAPVTSKFEIENYPSMGDNIAVETTPVQVGDHRIDLQYRFVDGDGTEYGVGKITHVTIKPDGGAKPLPDYVKRAANNTVDTKSSSLTETNFGDLPVVNSTYDRTFRIRSPHIEGSSLAYFEEYPRFAAIALEEYLDEKGFHLSDQDKNYNLKLRKVDWDFVSPVAYGAALTVNATVIDCTSRSITIAYSFEQEGRVLIEGWAEYSCFNSNGELASLDQDVRRIMSNT